ncbi:MAG: ComEA family DNA-binding protein [Microthrixaceae bacterium]
MASSRASDVLDSLLGRDELGGRTPVRRTLFKRDIVSRGGSFDGFDGATADDSSELSARSVVGTSVRPAGRPAGRPGGRLRGGFGGGFRNFAAGRRTLVILCAAVLAVTLLALATLGWQKLQRPLPIEERMPVAGADDGASTESSASEGPGSSGASPEADLGSSADGANSASGTAGGGKGQDGGEKVGSGKIVVHVAGAVLSPGVVTLGADSRVVDAITAAGGLRADADPDRVNLAEPLSDGVRIVVPAVGEDAIPDAVQLKMPQSSGATGGAGGGGAGSTPAALVNLNTATAAELEELPGVGPATSAAIIAKREKDGPFRSVDSLLDVRGIGEAKLEGLRDLVTVG